MHSSPLISRLGGVLCAGAAVLTLLPAVSCSNSSNSTVPSVTPAAPAITSFTPGDAAITAGGGTTLQAVFANGTGVVMPGSLAITSGTPITITPTTTTVYTLTVTGAGSGVATKTTTITVDAADTVPGITVPAMVTANSTGNPATVSTPEGDGTTYAWTITGGTITDGAGTTSIHYTAGASGAVQLTCTATNAANTPTVAGTARVTIVPAVLAPSITVPGSVPPATPGILASVAVQPGCIYAWSITGGTLTAGDGTSQVTFTSGASGAVTLNCTVTNGANASVAAPVATSTILGGGGTTSFIVSASAGPNGTMSPAAGTATVQSGASLSYTLTPADGYQIANVVVDAASLGPQGTAPYVVPFNAIAANHTLAVTFTDAAKAFPQHSKFFVPVNQPGAAQSEQDLAVLDHYQAWLGAYAKTVPGTNPEQKYILTAEGTTTSEAIGYAMVTSAYLGDQESFDAFYAYYLAHPSNASAPSYLMARQQTLQGGAMVSTGTADTDTGGDMDIAYALLIADQQWGSVAGPVYHAAALNALSDIIAYDVNNSGTGAGLVANTGYWNLKIGSAWDPKYTRPADFMMDHLLVFAEVDAANTWAWSNIYQEACAITMYQVPAAWASPSLSTATGLMPDYMVYGGLIQDDHALTNLAYFVPVPPTDQVVPAPAHAGDFGPGACTTPWRLASGTLGYGYAELDCAPTSPQNSSMMTWSMGIGGASPAGGTPTAFMNGYLVGNADATHPNGTPFGTQNDLAFTAPMAVPAMFGLGWQATPTYVPWMNAMWTSLTGGDFGKVTSYPGDAIRLQVLLNLTGNWWLPVTRQTYVSPGPVTAPVTAPNLNNGWNPYYVPPAGLEPSQVPQLVVWTFDDNCFSGDTAGGSPYSGGLQFLFDNLNMKNGSLRVNPIPASGLANPATFDGSNVLFTEYVIGNAMAAPGRGDDPGLVKKAHNKSYFQYGNEIGVHTWDHSELQDLTGTAGATDTPFFNVPPELFQVGRWNDQNGKDLAMLTAPFDPTNLEDPAVGVGLPASEIVGFRAPYTLFNDFLYTSLQSQGFTYDSSVEEGWEQDQSDKAGNLIDNLNMWPWPYTLDNGDVLVNGTTWQYNPWNRVLGKHAGLWEVAITCFIVPPDGYQCTIAGQLYTVNGARATASKNCGWFSNPPALTFGRFDGLDYNLYAQLKLDWQDILATFMYTLDQHYGYRWDQATGQRVLDFSITNRCPMVQVCHSDIYSSGNTDLNPPASQCTLSQRQEILREFINYANDPVRFPDVRMVNMKEALAYLANPVSLTSNLK